MKYCPNCKSDLTENKKLAQGIKECLSCKTRFFILITSQTKNSQQANTKPIDYTKTISFWTRLEMFVHNVKVNDLAGEEEKQMILNNCKEKQKMFIELESKHQS